MNNNNGNNKEDLIADYGTVFSNIPISEASPNLYQGLENFHNRLGKSGRSSSLSFNRSNGATEVRDYALYGKVYALSANFLRDTNLILPSAVTTSVQKTVGLESFMSDADVDQIPVEQITDLVEEAEIPEEDQEAAAEAVMTFLMHVRDSKGDPARYRINHFMTNYDTLARAAHESFSNYYATSLNQYMGSNVIPSNESFGANVDTVLPDLRDIMTVTLLQFHRGLLNRILHRRSTPLPYIRYKVPYAEVYDMLKSNDDDHMVRNEGAHIIPFIDLYGDPAAVTNQLTPVIPLKSNSRNGEVFDDGYLNFNVSCNLFDLARKPGQLGNSHTNYTDLLSENVVLEKVVISLTQAGSDPEYFEVDVHNLNGSRYLMQPNTLDSGIRNCNLHYVFLLDKKSKMSNGAESKLLSACTDTDKLRVDLRATSEINIKYSDVYAMGAVAAMAYNTVDAVIDPDVDTLAKSLKLEVVAYKVDAAYSEENLRKSNLAVRYNVRTMDFEISNGRNIMVDYSMNEDVPDFLMSLITEATSLGQDHRGLDVIVQQLMHVYDVTTAENKDPVFRNRLDKIGFQYVSAQQVRPVVLLNTLDMNNVDFIRSGDFLGDVRAYVEACLLNLTSLYFQNSFFRQQLAPGAKPVFKVITSSVILDNLFNIPHYHNHLMQESTADGTNVEYRRVLSNGVVLDCVSCNYNYMRDRIIMIPWVDDETSILSWGHNWDYGTFVAHYNPQLDNGLNKRIFANSRTMVIPTNPSGIYLDVQNISKIVDMYMITAPMNREYASSLPQPSEEMDPDSLPKPQM